MFQLTRQERAEVVANCDRLRKLKYSPTMPYAFTEHGAIMLASILNSEIATHASIQVVRAFLRLREILVEHKQLSSRLDELERKYDAQFKVVFDAIRELMSPKAPSRRRIGFAVEEAKRR